MLRNSSDKTLAQETRSGSSMEEQRVVVRAGVSFYDATVSTLLFWHEKQGLCCGWRCHDLQTCHVIQMVMTHVVVTININPGEQHDPPLLFSQEKQGHVPVHNNIIVVWL